MDGWNRTTLGRSIAACAVIAAQIVVPRPCLSQAPAPPAGRVPSPAGIPASRSLPIVDPSLKQAGHRGDYPSSQQSQEPLSIPLKPQPAPPLASTPNLAPPTAPVAPAYAPQYQYVPVAPAYAPQYQYAPAAPAYYAPIAPTYAPAAPSNFFLPPSVPTAPPAYNPPAMPMAPPYAMPMAPMLPMAPQPAAFAPVAALGGSSVSVPATRSSSRVEIPRTRDDRPRPGTLR